MGSISKNTGKYTDVYGESTTRCEKDGTIFDIYKIYVSGTLTRNGTPVDGDSRTYFKTNFAQVQLVDDSRQYKPGKYSVTSLHEAVSGADHGDSDFWTSKWLDREYR